jgi:hypothetical protein
MYKLLVKDLNRGGVKKLSTTQEITDIVLAWMPLIIVFAMLGMVLGMLKKFGKF